jgi:DNA polymerase III subunit alpha
MYFVFDTETTGLPKSFTAPISDTTNWPRCVQIAWQLHDEMGKVIEYQDFLIKPDNFNIPFDAERVHGISTELATKDGKSIVEVLEIMNFALEKTQFVVGHNVAFDLNIMLCEYFRYGVSTTLNEIPILDTCTENTAKLLKLPGGRGGSFKLPTLTELHDFLFQVPFKEAHNATADVEATTRCFFELIRKDAFDTEDLNQKPSYFVLFKEKNPNKIEPIGLKHVNLKEASNSLRLLDSSGVQKYQSVFTQEDLDKANFVHLHTHSQFSMLQSTVDVAGLIKKAVSLKMPAVAMTDTNNLMGAFHFVSGVLGHNKAAKATNEKAIEAGETPTATILKPIVGCELNVCDNHLDKTKKDNGYQIVLLAKNKEGYQNISKLTSLAHTKGFYYVPRIDKNLLLEYKENIIVLSGGMLGEISSKLLNVGQKQAEEALLWYYENFGQDFYLELVRHQQEDEDNVNETLLSLAHEYQIKTIATNNVYYLNQEDANAHDILLCVKDGEKQETPIGRGRGYRSGLPNQEYFFKNAEEMKELFEDIPEAIINIQEIIDKVEIFDLAREVLLPKFDIPQEFINEEDETDNGKRGENAYLKHLTYQGAAKRYETITPEIQERLDFELQIIEKTGYPGYFLIVQDFIAAARSMDVSVGPGRGSAAGSVVAYCLWITNIDPLAYDLLFERFLNPDRVSMPDIDIDFDDEGRGKVMDYVINKYGRKQVAQIITYGKMATKSAIRDTARVLDLPLFESDKLAKLIPNMMPSKWNLARFLSEKEDEVKKALRAEEFEKVKQLIQFSKENDLQAETINQAKILEGNLRNTGIHACGVIITPDDITNFVPVSTAKDSDLFVTQFDNSVVESAGLLKMDFLGLKTLTLIKDTVKLVKYRLNIDLDPDTFPKDDLKTYELFQRGETVGIFQYESSGMQKYLRELKPTVFEDLIAMNALYRPGPLEYIPSFVKRKNGLEAIEYDLEANEEYLKETYGITVYQEQVMLLSQKLASFSKGDADVLRKAMGKKQKDVLDKMKSKFISQAVANGHDAEKLEKIWKDWEAFAQYAFNKSHSTCYAWIGYQTAYLKAHYPAEYMAAVLSNNMNDIKSVSFFMEECKRMGIKVLGPDVNESYYKFTVNEDYAIRFGMGAVKGVGEQAVLTISENRKKAPYKSIFDMAKKLDLRAANKKAFDNLALAGAFDCFKNVHRAQYFHTEQEGITFLEKAIKFGGKFQENENASQISLFGDSSEVQIPEPTIPNCEEWSTLETLAKEKEVVGIYISGHPLDDYKFEMKHFCTSKADVLQNLAQNVGKVFAFGGIVSNVQNRVAKNGNGWASFTLEGYEESAEFRIFGEDYLKYQHLLVMNNFIFVKIFIKDGYPNKETGLKGEPRIQYQIIHQLQDVIPNYAKKIILQFNVFDINEKKINELLDIFNKNKGDKPLQIDVLEIIKKQTANAPLETPEIKETSNENEEEETILDETGELKNIDIDVEEETQVITQINMPSRKVRVNINNELLQELELKNVYFSLV